MSNAHTQLLFRVNNFDRNDPKWDAGFRLSELRHDIASHPMASEREALLHAIVERIAMQI